MGVPPFSTGNREQVPSEQSQFWTAHALPIIPAYADHFHSLDRCQPAAALLRSWQGGTLGLCCTGGCHPSQHHVHDSSLALRLSHSISPGGFFTGSPECISDSRVCSPPPPPFPPPPDVPQPYHPVDLPSATSKAPSPFTVAPSPSQPRSPFAFLPPTTAPASGNSDLPPPVVAGLFAQHPAPPSVATSPPVPEVNSSFSPL